MVMGKAGAKDIVARIMTQLKATYHTAQEPLEGLQYGHSRGTDEDFLDIFSKEAANPSFVVMLALDDEQNGRDWLNRHRQLTGVDLLGMLIEQMLQEEAVGIRPPGEAALVMAKSVATEREKAQ